MNFNQMDASALAAWIALIVAIISPILTAIINNRHQTKMKKNRDVHSIQAKNY